MTRNDNPRLSVTFLGCSRDPIEIIYAAHRINRHQDDAVHLWRMIQEKTISRGKMIAGLPRSISRKYRQELKQTQFLFLVDNISRIAAHTLNQPSRDGEDAGLIVADLQDAMGEFTSATPPAIAKNTRLFRKWETLQAEMTSFYQACQREEIDSEDLEYLLPQGLLCREQISMNFQSMQHFLDEAMCEQSHWEIRELSRQIYELMKREFPSLSVRLGIKCWENRNLFCDEAVSDYEACCWRTTRPHQSHLRDLWQNETGRLSESTLL